MTLIVDAVPTVALSRGQHPEHRPFTAAQSPVAPSGANQRQAIDGTASSLILRPDERRLAGKPNVSDPVFVAAFLANLVLSVTAQAGEESMWAKITDAAVTLIPGAEHAGIKLTADPPPASASAIDSPGIMQLLMKAHDSTGEGPCRDAANHGGQILVSDLHSDIRWPRLAARAPWELRSMLCTPIVVPGATVGVLVAMSTRAWAFDDTAAQLATVATTYAALALTHVEQIRNLRVMAQGRDVIGQAKGILMQRHHITADEALHTLTRASHNSNFKLLTLCQHLADTGDSPIPPPPAPNVNSRSGAPSRTPPRRASGPLRL